VTLQYYRHFRCHCHCQTAPQLKMSMRNAIPYPRGDANTRQNAKHWVFTINNPTEEDADTLSQFECTYMVYQKEQGENGTVHYQGVFGLPQCKRFSTIKNLLPRAHLEVARDVRSSIKYCQKEDTRIEGPWVRGDVPRDKSGEQGQRSDLREIQRKIKAGANTRQIMDEHFGSFVRYKGGIQYALLHYTPPRDFQSRIFIFYGPSQTGKTWTAKNKFAPAATVTSIGSDSKVWMDLYDPMYHETVIFDEFYGGMKWGELLQLTDEYEYHVHTKGGFLQFRPKNIIFTSNDRPESWYKKICLNPVKWPAFINRVRRGGLFYVPNRGQYILEHDSDGNPIGSMPPELAPAGTPSPDISHYESDDE